MHVCISALVLRADCATYMHIYILHTCIYIYDFKLQRKARQPT